MSISPAESQMALPARPVPRFLYSIPHLLDFQEEFLTPKWVKLANENNKKDLSSKIYYQCGTRMVIFVLSESQI